MMCGTLLSVSAFTALRTREYRAVELEFNLTCENYRSAVKREIEANLSVLRSFAAFAEVAGPIDRTKFETFARKEAGVNPTLLAIEWLPHVAGPEREAFERKLSEQEGRPVQIMEGPPDRRVVAGERPDYFPIELMYPKTAALQVIGFDGLEQLNIREVLERARDTGQPIQAAKFRMAERTADGFGIPVYLAVYQAGTPQGTVDERRRNLSGFALTIFEVAAVLERAVGQITPRNINIQFYDLSAPVGKRLLHFHPASLAAGRAGPLPDREALTPGDFKFAEKFRVASRDWAMVCTPTAEYLGENRAWLPWITLLAGMAGTLATVAYISLSVAYTNRAEGLVAQLYNINSHLTTEIRERKKAEQEISRLNTGLERRVSERTEELRESEQRYALAARGSKDGLWDWNLVSGEVYYSTRWKNMLGCSEEEISIDPEEWLGRIHSDDVDRVKAEIAAHRSGETAQFQSEHRMRHRDGSYRWMLARGVAVFDERRRAARMAGSQTDITEGKVADPLTGLANRLFLTDRLVHAVERMREGKTRLFAVLFLDLDRFKLVNDSLGHHAGDRFLVAIAGRLKNCAASLPEATGCATVARVGGDEFAILLDGIASSLDATEFAGQIHAALRPPFLIQGHQLFASCSIGVAMGSADTTSEDLLRDADTAMYHAKARGPHRHEIFDAGMRQQAIDRLQLESDLRVAVQRGELSVHYQPKVSLATGRVIEFEALLRWDHPVRGMISPNEFIPLADETGIIVQLGEWVLAQACSQLGRWRKSLGCNLGISVNLSTRQFQSPELMAQVRRTLAETGLPPYCLSLEITESLLVENAEEAIRLLNQFRDMGIGLKIDDFGTGFSSLSYLHRLPFNELKIDRSFIEGIGGKRDTADIIRTIVLMARALGMTVVAEGVETSEQLLKLVMFGCDYGQGKLFSGPLPAAEAEALIASCEPVPIIPSAAGPFEDAAALGELFQAS
jgi:diguanylate cyclase (GGDEF)-like protein/PAS domain S-box-containing protein